MTPQQNKILERALEYLKEVKMNNSDVKSITCMHYALGLLESLKES